MSRAEWLKFIDPFVLAVIQEIERPKPDPIWFYMI